MIPFLAAALALLFLLAVISLVVAIAAFVKTSRIGRDLDIAQTLIASLERRAPAAATPPRSEAPGAARAGSLAGAPQGIGPPASAPPAVEPPPLAPPKSPAEPPVVKRSPAPIAFPDTTPVRVPSPPASLSPPPDDARDSAGPKRGGESWEIIIGSSWLNRIGVALLVLSIAFALGYTLTIVGPLGKSLLAATSSLAMIAGGVILERRASWAFYGRGLIGGGWAAFYATAYAVHELEATRVVESPVVGFLLLLAVGIGMILHSLRYANEGLTGIAYGLAYAAIAIHSISPYTLAAATLLGFGTVLHLIRRSWYVAAIGGIVATYGSLFLWYLRQDELTSRTLVLGLSMIVVDWVVFLAPDFSTRPREDRRRLASAVSLLNAAAAGGLSLLAWQRFFPGSAWGPPAILGAAYAITAVVLRRSGRLSAHRMHTLVAALLVALAAGKGLNLTAATWVWLVEAQAVILIALYLRDHFHRWLGSALFLIPTTAVLVDQIPRRLERSDGGLDLHRLALAAVACGFFYMTQARLRRADAADPRAAGWLRSAFSYAAFLMILLATWVQVPAVWFAPCIGILVVILFECSARWRVSEFRVQSWIAAGIAVLAALDGSGSTVMVGGLPGRTIAGTIVAASLLVFFLRLKGARLLLASDEAWRPLLSWSAAALGAFVVWNDARPTMVGPLWILLAFLFVEGGLAVREAHLRRPGYLLLAAGNLSLVLSNLTATSEVMGVSVRTATIVPALMADYYLWWRLRSLQGMPSNERSWDEGWGRALSYIGAILVGLYSRFQFGLEGAALRWAVAMVVLFFLGDRLRDADFRVQAYALGAAVMVRAVGFDFRNATQVLGVDGALAVTVIGVAAYAGGALLIRARAAAPREDRRSLRIEKRLARHGADGLWIMAVALAAIYSWRVHSGYILVILWALEGLAASAIGFALRTVALRYAGMTLLGLGLSLTVVRTFTTFDMIGRIVSFLVLGLVLLLISFGYTRYRQRFRRNP